MIGDFAANRFITLLWPVGTTALTWYVRPTGDDNNDGTTALTAFATLGRALREVPLYGANQPTIIDVTGMTITNVLGCGTQKGRGRYYRGVKVGIQLLPKIQVDIVVSKVPVQTVIDAARRALYTGNIGDGKIFVYNVEDVVRIRTGETGYDALQIEDE